MPDHCGCTQHEQSAQVAITLFGDPTLALFAAAAVLSGHQPDPGRKVASGVELKRVGNRSDIADAVIGPTPGIAASRRLASLSLCHLTIDPSICFTRLCSASSSVANPRSASRASAGTFVVSSRVLPASGAYRNSPTSFHTPATASRAALAISPLSLAIVVRRKPIRIMRAA
jgi:hypothetical protein